MMMINIKTIQQIHRQFGTPTYLYCFDTIRKQYNKVRKNLTNKCEIFYSMKANPLLSICRYMVDLKAGCDVSSKHELMLALQVGFDPQKIIFVGPGKSREELTLCVQYEIKAVVCESIDEIVDIDNISKKQGKKTNILVRLNPNFSMKNASLKMSGVPSQFGIAPEELIKYKNCIRRCKNIVIMGIHVYNGSRVLEAAAIIDNVHNVLLLADTLSKQMKLRWSVIDFGGGFGVPYFECENQLAIDKVITGINKAIREYVFKYPKTIFIMELGRYLVAESGTLISSVIRVKTNHDRKYVVVDAGTHCYASGGHSVSLFQHNYPAIHLSEKNNINKNKTHYQVVGPLCTPSDMLLSNVAFSEVCVGDYILLLYVGAYGPTYAAARFISHGMPAEVVFYKNKFRLARRRESFENIVENQIDIQ
jgi:diaminopimelate decarboxylase